MTVTVRDKSIMEAMGKHNYFTPEDRINEKRNLAFPPDSFMYNHIMRKPKKPSQ